MRYGNAPLDLWMPELGMRANFGNFIPADEIETLMRCPQD
jgi:hypothetical protein